MRENNDDNKSEIRKIDAKIDDINIALKAYNRVNEDMDICERQLKNDLQRLEDKWRHDGKISSLLCSAQEELHIVNSNRLENNDEIRFATKKDIENLEDEQNRLRESNDEDD